MNLLVRTGTHLKTVLPRTPANEWLGPMKEAPSFEGAFLFQVHPHREGTGGGVLVTVGAWSRPQLDKN